jgi:hypothetical protein
MTGQKWVRILPRAFLKGPGDALRPQMIRVAGIGNGAAIGQIAHAWSES